MDQDDAAGAGHAVGTDDGDQHEPRPRTWRRPVAMGAATVLVVAGGWLAWAAAQPPKAKFCQASLAIGEVGGRFVILQDQGGDGRDGCDLDEVPEPGDPIFDEGAEPLVLGFDCKVRDVDGTVVATTTPSQPGGEC